jgi:hypothetical protein
MKGAKCLLPKTVNIGQCRRIIAEKVVIYLIVMLVDRRRHLNVPDV